MKELFKLLLELESKIPSSEKVNLSVSSSPVGWHIEHSTMAINNIINSLKNSKPEEYRWKFSLPRIIVFTTGVIPRGRGKAPESAQPKNTSSFESLKKKIDEAKIKVKELENLSGHNYFEHHVFGRLDLNNSIKFLKIHTNHHLKIINELVKSY